MSQAWSDISGEQTVELDPVEVNGSGELPSPTGEPDSVLQALRARRQTHAADRHVDLDVPGYRGLLVLRLGPIPSQTMSRLRERAERSRSPERDYNLNADTLIAACRQVLGRARPTDELQLLVDPEGEPVRIDERLAELLGVEGVKDARGMLRVLYEGANSPELAVAAAGGQYVEWASGANNEIDEELLGES
jgi:hypothetical protein